MTDRADDVAEEQEGEGEAEEQQGSSKKKLILFGLIGFLLLAGGGGAAAYFLGVFDGGDAQTEEAKTPDPEPVFFYDLPEITVNLQTLDDREVFLKLRVALELKDQAQVARIEPFLPRILDAFQFYLHEVRSTDLEGSAGLFRLKEELQRRINQAIYPVKVDDVLFKEVLVQ